MSKKQTRQEIIDKRLKKAAGWDLMNLPGIEKLPAIQWKLANIKKMHPEHHQKSVERLKTILEL